jgi:hypothetical protein
MLKNSILGFLALSMLIIAGCSSHDAVKPAPADQSVALQATIGERFAGLSEKQMLSELSMMVRPADPRPVAGESFRDAKGVMREYGITPGESAGKIVPLPAPLTVATMAAGAMYAVDHGNTWGPLTTFVHFNGAFWGYQVSWLEDIPEDPDPNAFYCNYYLDTPVINPPQPEYVAPYSPPIYDSAVRIVAALGNPSSCVNRYYSAGGPVIYDYAFDYPYAGGYRRAEFLRFRLYINP